MKRNVFSLVAAFTLFFNGFGAIVTPEVVIEDSHSCFDYADRESKRMGFLQGWTYEQQHQAFLFLYDTCVASQNNTLQEAP